MADKKPKTPNNPQPNNPPAYEPPTYATGTYWAAPEKKEPPAPPPPAKVTLTATVDHRSGGIHYLLGDTLVVLEADAPALVATGNWKVSSG